MIKDPSIGKATQFKKGVSPNPGGRPKQLSSIVEMARKQCPKALDVLIECLNSRQDKIKIQAACALLDRGFGKPAQPIEGEMTHKVLMGRITIDGKPLEFDIG